MIRVDAVTRMDFVYDELAEALGEEPGSSARPTSRRACRPTTAGWSTRTTGRSCSPIPRTQPSTSASTCHGPADAPSSSLPTWPPGPPGDAQPPGGPSRPDGSRPAGSTRANRPSPHPRTTGGPHGQGTAIRRRCPAPAAGRRRAARRLRQTHPRAQGPQRDPGTDHRLPRGHQRRRDHRPRDLPARPVREHGRPAGQGSRDQDQRHRRRRDDDGDRAGRGDRPTGHDGDRERRQPGPRQARDRRRGRPAGRAPGRRGPPAAHRGRLPPRGGHLGQRRRDDRQRVARALYTVGDGGVVTVEDSAVLASTSTSSRTSSSTTATSPRTWSPTSDGSRPSSRTATSS